MEGLNKNLLSFGDKNFREVVVEKAGAEIFSCYQCSKCSAGCPVAFAMDLLPHQVIRSVLFYKKEKVLSSRTIWVCASCETCTTRCPNEIDIAKLMDVLRQMQRESGTKPCEPKISLLHTVFLDAIKRSGRIHELSMLRNFFLKSGDAIEKIKSGEWKNDVKLGLKMFLRGKLKIIPSRCKSVREVRRIFEEAEKVSNRF
jgi:heterodisulfide reductase subunit C